MTLVDYIIMSLDSKHAEACFSPSATDSLYLLVAQVPRPSRFMYGDFCAHDDNDDNSTTDYFTPCTCARSNYHRILPTETGD